MAGLLRWALVVWLAAMPALGETERDRIDAQLARIDAAVALSSPKLVEAAMEAALETASAAGELEPFWVAFGTAFESTHADTLRLLRAWYKAMPESAWAGTALSRALLHRAFLHRGTDHDVFVPTRNMAEYRRDASEAARLSKAAIAADDRMVSAYFVIFTALRNRVYREDIAPLIKKLIQVFPERRAVNAAAGAFSPSGVGSVDIMLQVCDRYAPRIPGYDAEACHIYVLFTHARNDVRAQRIREALARRDEPWLDAMRLINYFEFGGPGYRTPELGEQMLALHRHHFDQGVELTQWLERAQLLAWQFGTPLYEVEARERAAPYLSDLDRRDPYDYHRIRDEIDIANKSPNLRPDEAMMSELRQKWPRAMVYGQHVSYLWLRGSTLVEDWTDVDARLPYLTNMVVTSTDRVQALSWALQDLLLIGDSLSINLQGNGIIPGLSREQMNERLDRITCGVLPMAKALRAACQPNLLGVRAPGCSPDNRTLLRVSELLSRVEAENREIGEAAQCAEITGQPDETFRFGQMVPVPGLDAFLQTVDRGPD